MNVGFGRWSQLGLVALALLGSAPRVARAQEPRVITIAAKRFEFSPSEVRLKKGEPVTMGPDPASPSARTEPEDPPLHGADDRILRLVQSGPAEHHVEHAEERDHRIERILPACPRPEAARELTREPPGG
jgi:hypothetical protein